MYTHTISVKVTKEFNGALDKAISEANIQKPDYLRSILSIGIKKGYMTNNQTGSSRTENSILKNNLGEAGPEINPGPINHISGVGGELMNPDKSRLIYMRGFMIGVGVGVSMGIVAAFLVVTKRA